MGPRLEPNELQFRLQKYQDENHLPEISKLIADIDREACHLHKHILSQDTDKPLYHLSVKNHPSKNSKSIRLEGTLLVIRDECHQQDTSILVIEVEVLRGKRLPFKPSTKIRQTSGSGIGAQITSHLNELSWQGNRRLPNLRVHLQQAIRTDKDQDLPCEMAPT